MIHDMEIIFEEMHEALRLYGGNEKAEAITKAQAVYEKLKTLFPPRNDEELPSPCLDSLLQDFSIYIQAKNRTNREEAADQPLTPRHYCEKEGIVQQIAAKLEFPLPVFVSSLGGDTDVFSISAQYSEVGGIQVPICIHAHFSTALLDKPEEEFKNCAIEALAGLKEKCMDAFRLGGEAICERYEVAKCGNH